MRISKIQKALDYARLGSEDGEHHKQWVIDQMVRALTDCPTIKAIGLYQETGEEYQYKKQGKSDAYKKWVKRQSHWNEGIAP
ncbi:MAG: hypothetical protein WC877_03320 [Dehalococcoidales bacterium]|jgi:hypothetical protein|nr:hypothetical protein [Candidatus Neomarinimicrobiota bacterium]